MTWEQRYRLAQSTRTSLVFWATLALVAALLCAPGGPVGGPGNAVGVVPVQRC